MSRLPWTVCLGQLWKKRDQRGFRLAQWSTRCLNSSTSSHSILTFRPQTDRPSSQFWNSGMLRGHQRLAIKHQVTIRHITEQSMHNKVFEINVRRLFWRCPKFTFSTFTPDPNLQNQISQMSGHGRWRVCSCQDGFKQQSSAS